MVIFFAPSPGPSGKFCPPQEKSLRTPMYWGNNNLIFSTILNINKWIKCTRWKYIYFCCKSYLQEIGQNEQRPEVQNTNIIHSQSTIFFVSAFILTIIRLNCKKITRSFYNYNFKKIELGLVIIKIGIKWW